MIVDCVIPLFNKKNYISKAIESAINLKIKKFNNIIIVNDGSTDGSDLIVEKLSKKYPSIKLINQINLGSSMARNVGIKNSNADYLVFLDADDQLNNKYLFCLHLMKFYNPDCKVFSTKHFNIYNNKEIIDNSNNLKIFKSKIVKLNNPILNYSFNPKLFCSSGICVERNIILNNLFPKNVNVGEDIYTWLKIFQNNKLILYNKDLIYIFKNSENRSINIFQETLDKIVYLAVLMPIVASMGGVAATQTLTIVLRGLTLGQINRSNIRWLFKRELAVSIVNGIVLSLLVGFITYFWFQNIMLSILISCALIINLISSVFAGVFVPLILRKLNQDPAISGSVVVTTVTDVVGFLSFLGLVTLFLI